MLLSIRRETKKKGVVDKLDQIDERLTVVNSYFQYRQPSAVMVCSMFPERSMPQYLRLKKQHQIIQ